MIQFIHSCSWRAFYNQSKHSSQKAEKIKSFKKMMENF